MVTGMVNLGILNEISNLLPINTELGMSWDTQSARSIPLTINLVNTNEKVIQENLELISGLNVSSRFEQAGPKRYPPNVFEVTVPGLYKHPWMAVSNLSVSTVGTFFQTVLRNSSEPTSIPQGYQIKMSLIELVPITAAYYKKEIADRMGVYYDDTIS